MTSFLMFEREMGLTVYEDIETVRERLAEPHSDGLAELHVGEKKVFVRVEAVKYALEETETPGNIGF